MNLSTETPTDEGLKARRRNRKTGDLATEHRTSLHGSGFSGMFGQKDEESASFGQCQEDRK